MGVDAYLRLIHAGNLGCTASSFQKLLSVADEKTESLLHHLPLGLIVDLSITQLLHLFGDGFLQELVAPEQSGMEPPQLGSAVLGGRRRDRHQAAVGRWNLGSKPFFLFLAEKTEEAKKEGRTRSET